MDLEAAIDELYQQPPADFVAARNALAKTLKGADAARVRALPKPTVPAWTVNQLYWRDRRAFDRLVNEGARLRNVQIAALQGHKADVRAATEGHRAAVGAAVQRATELARDAHVEADPESVARTIEALSLSPPDVTPGRLTRPLQPAGFEALAGITVTAPIPEQKPVPATHAKAHSPEPAPARIDHPRAVHEARRTAAAQREAVRQRATREREAREREAAERRAAAREEKARRHAAAELAAKRRAAERDVERARQDRERARHALAAAEKRLADAELTLRAL